ncbi:MAG: RNA pseudouridine synthase [Lachnospiraceae bacterium]|nr:RNA pseudouridine synthase [Lachnospiraceae bacterium]
MGIDIRYEDEYILVCYKPAGIPSQTAKINEDDMISRVRRYLLSKDKKSDLPQLVHRLDQPVSGLMLFAKDKDILRKLNTEIVKGHVSKRYIAKVTGVVSGDKGKIYEIKNYLLKEGRENRARVFDKPETCDRAKEAVLKYRIKETDKDNNTSILDIDLITGRFHQIRAQLSHIGHPIIGDVKYGYPKDNSKGVVRGIALCAYSISFIHPVKKGKITVKIPENEITVVDFPCKD